MDSILTATTPHYLSQGFWTTTTKNFYHPNKLSTRCMVQSFNSWSIVPFGVAVQTRWLNLATEFQPGLGGGEIRKRIVFPFKFPLCATNTIRLPSDTAFFNTFIWNLILYNFQWMPFQNIIQYMLLFSQKSGTSRNRRVGLAYPSPWLNLIRNE